MNGLESFMFVLQGMLCVCFKLCMFYALWPFDVAKGGEKNGYFKKSRYYIFKTLKLSINSNRKGEKGMSER